MRTYYTEQEFEQVVTDKLCSAIIEKKAKMSKELSCVYFHGLPDVEYAIRGKAVLKTSYDNNGYFIVTPKENL